MTTAPERAPVTTRVRVARTLSEVEELRETWHSLAPTEVDADIDHFLTVVRHDRDTVAPHVLVVERPGRAPMLVVARLARHRLRIRAGYLPLLDLRVRALLVSFGGVLGVAGDEDLDLAVAALQSQLTERAATMVVLQKVPESSQVRAAVERAAPGRRRGLGPDVIHCALRLPDSFDALLAERPSKSRQRIRRERSVFQRDFRDRWEVQRSHGLDLRPELERDLETITLRSYQHSLGVGSVDDALRGALLASAVSLGRLRAWVLRIDGRPAAFWWGIAFEGTLFSGATGFDPGLAAARVGHIAMLHLVEDCCADPTIRRIDFGHGDAEYKRRFADLVTTCHDVRIFTDRPRSQAVRIALGVAAGLSQRLGPAVAGSAFARRAKRTWRHRGRTR